MRFCKWINLMKDSQRVEIISNNNLRNDAISHDTQRNNIIYIYSNTNFA